MYVKLHCIEENDLNKIFSINFCRLQCTSVFDVLKFNAKYIINNKCTIRIIYKIA